MKWKHLWAIVRKEFYHALRDPGTLFMLTVGPVLFMVIFVYSFVTDVKDVAVAIVDLADNERSAELIARIDETKEAKVTHRLATREELDPLIERGEVRAAIVIKEGYASLQSYLIGDSAPLEIVIDGTEPTSAERVLERVYEVVEDHIRLMAEETFSFLPGFDPALLEMPITIETVSRYNPDLRGLVSFYPGLAAMVLSIPSMTLALVLAREQELGTMEQLVAMPISKVALLLGKMIPYMLFGLADAVILLAMGRFLYGVPFRGSVLGYLMLSALFLFANMGIGLLISVLVRSQQLAIVLSALIFLIPGFFLSGIFFPLSMMPDILRIELQMMPIAHYVEVSKRLYLQGTPIMDLWFNAAILLATGVFIMAVSVFLFRKKVA